MLIEQKVELPTVTLLDVWYELMADAMKVTKEEAQKILHTNHKN